MIPRIVLEIIIPTQYTNLVNYRVRDASVTIIAAAACSLPSRSDRNGKSCVPPLRETKFRKDNYAQEHVSPNPRPENSESSLPAAGDFGSIW